MHFMLDPKLFFSQEHFMVLKIIIIIIIKVITS